MRHKSGRPVQKTLGLEVVSGDVVQRTAIMDLTSDFDKPAAGIEVLADRVLLQRFDSRVGQPEPLKITKCVLNERPADSCTSVGRIDCQIWYKADAGVAVDQCCNIANYLTMGLGDKAAVGVFIQLAFDLFGFSPLPIFAGDEAELPLDVPVDRDPLERLDCQGDNARSIVRSITAYGSGHDQGTGVGCACSVG